MLGCEQCVEGAVLQANTDCSCMSDYEDTGSACQFTRKKVLFSLSVASDNEITLSFTAALELSRTDFQVSSVIALDISLERVTGTEYKLLLTTDLAIEEATLLTVTLSEALLSRPDIEVSPPSASGQLTATSKPRSSEEQTAQAVLSTTQTVVIVAVTASLPAGFAQGNLSASWLLVNTLALLGYIPMMSLDLPLPLSNFFTAILDFNLIPNVFPYFVANKGAQPCKEAARIGADSSLFLLTAGESLTSFFLFLLLWPFSWAGSKVLCGCVAKQCAVLTKQYQWSYFLRFVQESYVSLLFSAVLQVSNFSFASYSLGINSSLAGFALVLCCVVPPAVTYFVFKCSSQFPLPNFKDKWGSLFEEFKNDRGSQSSLFYALFFWRRLLYMSLLFFLPAYPVVQAVLNQVHTFAVSSTQVIVFLLHYFPFSHRLLGWTCFLDELVTALTFALTSVYLFDLDSSTRSTLQWLVLGVCYSMIGLNVLVSLYTTVEALTLQFRKWRLKRQTAVSV
jgi:hypothetical protein